MPHYTNDNINDEDVFEIHDHFVYRNGKQIPYVPHEKREGRSTIDPKFFVYHYTAGRFGIEGCVNFLKNSNTKADVHLVLARDGELVQMAPLNEKCWHAGKSEYNGYTGLNSHSCGIEVINPGPMNIVSPGVYKTWYGDTYYNPHVVTGSAGTPNEGIVEAPHQIYDKESIYGWLPYSKHQINVMTSVSQAICNFYNAELVGHDEITSRKRDPGPLSQIDSMRTIINGREDDNEQMSDNLREEAELIHLIHSAPSRNTISIDTNKNDTRQSGNRNLLNILRGLFK